MSNQSIYTHTSAPPFRTGALFSAMFIIPALLLSTPSVGAIVENGATLSIDGTTLLDDYTVRGGSTLNANGASANFIDIQSGSQLNLVGGSVNAVGNDGVEVTNSSAAISGNAFIKSDFVGLLINRVVGTTSGSAVTVNDSTIVGADAGARITGLSSLVLTNSTVTGTGTSGYGLNITGGEVQANNTIIRGQSNGILLTSDPQGLGSPRLTLNGSGTSVTGVSGAALRINSGVNAIIDLNNGATLTGGNGNLLEVQGASSAALNVAGSSLNGNVLVSGNSTANLTFNQAQMTGDLQVDAGSTGTLKLDNNSLFTGNLINVESVTVNSQSNWAMAGNNTLSSLAMDQGRVTFGGAKDFYQLNVGTLSGNGTFVMDVDYINNLHDTLNVTGTATGNHNLLIAGSGTDPVSPEQLNLVRIGAGDANFSLPNGPVAVGTYSYGLASRPDGSGGTEWFLDPSQATISPGTSSVLALFNTAPTVWYGELTSLRTRMGELRFNGGKAGGWVRTYGNKYDVAEASGVGYKQNQQGISLGADAPLAIGDGQWLIGALVGYSKSDLDLTRGTSGTVKSSYIGAYTTWLDQDSGYYFDGVLKFNRFENESKVSMSDGARSKGDYDNVGMGGSLEFGRHIKLNDGYFVEPFSQLSAVVIQGKDYGLDNGMEAEGDRTRSLLGKVGVTAGRNFTLDSGTIVQPYIRAAVAHEFAKNNEVQVNNNVFNNDLSGSRGELGAGLAAALTDRLQLHADFDYSNGEHIEQPFGANVGVRYSW